MKLSRLVVLVVAASLLGSCFSVTSQAPYGPPVKLLTADAPVQVTRKYQKWFILWGIIPLTPADAPREIIKSESLVEVRISAEDTIWDLLASAVISVMTIGIFNPQTVVVEGNRTPTR